MASSNIATCWARCVTAACNWRREVWCLAAGGGIRRGERRRLCATAVGVTLAGAARLVGIAINLQAGDPEARYAVPVNRALPSQELFDRKLIASACFL